MAHRKSSASGGSSTLAGLTDTNITSPADGEQLYYDADTGKWYNAAAASGSQNLVINVKDAPYSAAGNGTADDTEALQDALDAAYAAGGGIVYMPKGTYGVTGTGDASDGGIRIKDNVTLLGAGMGATTIKLLNAQGSNAVTGIIRTPVDEPTRRVTLKNFTVDGNKANCTGDNKAIFFGVTPAEAITVSVVGTTATATTVSGNHNLTNAQTYYIKNGDNPGLTGDFVVTVTGATTFTFTVANGTASDAVGYTWFYNRAFANIADEDIYIESVEAKDCTSYGFDPHECVRRLKMVGCISHGHGASGDGFTFDGCFDCVVENCYSYDNARNGFTFVTGSAGNSYIGCHAWGNGQYGFADQRGSSLINRNRDNSFINCVSRNNTQIGFRLQMSINATVQGCHAYENGRNGIILEGSQHCIIHGNHVHSNGQTTTNTYDEIRVKEYTFSADSVTYPSQYNNIDNNNLTAPLSKKSRYLMREDDDSSNYNSWRWNKLGTNGASGGASIATGNVNSTLLEDSDIDSTGADENVFLSTMTTSGTAAANIAAFLSEAPSAIAAGKIYKLPVGDIPFGYNDGTAQLLNLTSGDKFVMRGAPGGLTRLVIPDGDYQSYLRISTLATATDYTVNTIATATSGANLSTTSEVTKLTLASPPGSLPQGTMVSSFSDDLLPGYESADERNYTHFISEALGISGSDVYLGRKLPRTQTTGYCKLRVYDNTDTVVDIDDVTFVASGDIYDTGVALDERPSFVMSIEGIRDAVIGSGVRIESAWGGGIRYASTMGVIDRSYSKQILNGLTGVTVLGYHPAFYGPNLNPRIEGKIGYNGRHTPTTIFFESGTLTITGITPGNPTVIAYSSANHNPAIGDRMEFSGIVGTMSALNGTKHTVTARTGSTSSGTITIAYDSSALSYSSGGTINHFQPENAFGYGETEGLEVLNVTSLFSNGKPFDSHAGALGTHYKNCAAKFPYTLTAGAITPVAFAFRGNSEKVTNFDGERLTGLVTLQAYGQTTGLPNINVFSKISLHDQQDRAAAKAYFEATGNSASTDFKKLIVNDMQITGGAYRIGSFAAYSCEADFNRLDFTGDWGVSAATQYMFDFAVAGKTMTVSDSTFDLSQTSTTDDVRIASLTNGTMIFKRCKFKALGATTVYAFNISGSGGTLTFEDCEFEYDSSATDNTVRLIQNNNVTATVNLKRCKVTNGAKVLATRGLVYSTGASAVTTINVINLERDTLAANIVGTGSTAGTYTLNETVPTYNLRGLAKTSAFTLSLPANNRIDSITIVNTTANAISGGLKIGSTNGGTEVVAAQAVGANGLVTVLDADLLKRFFSSSVAQTLYFDAVSSWNSASINLTIKHSEI